MIQVKKILVWLFRARCCFFSRVEEACRALDTRTKKPSPPSWGYGVHTRMPTHLTPRFRRGTHHCPHIEGAPALQALHERGRVIAPQRGCVQTQQASPHPGLIVHVWSPQQCHASATRHDKDATTSLCGVHTCTISTSKQNKPTGPEFCGVHTCKISRRPCAPGAGLPGNMPCGHKSRA